MKGELKEVIDLNTVSDTMFSKYQLPCEICYYQDLLMPLTFPEPV